MGALCQTFLIPSQMDEGAAYLWYLKGAIKATLLSLIHHLSTSLLAYLPCIMKCMQRSIDHPARACYCPCWHSFCRQAQVTSSSMLVLRR